jgi:hypothetical protein
MRHSVFNNTAINLSGSAGAAPFQLNSMADYLCPETGWASAQPGQHGRATGPQDKRDVTDDAAAAISVLGSDLPPLAPTPQMSRASARTNDRRSRDTRWHTSRDLIDDKQHEQGAERTRAWPVKRYRSSWSWPSQQAWGGLLANKPSLAFRNWWNLLIAA